ncbi:hypothetical protein OF897_07460 [Chryseobacterium formosus]|uniref:Immunity protein 53 of polymorphic toxin system n=1 Tax=Chryseobacterium formosus TaxID=1537363 RepID=A0ABT3XNQ1_9FLAO|nr:hypothetical protein [Chryseobacterium formosus]MCX8523759.1 hypothetical protein [Chryseobacterium formosus]
MIWEPITLQELSSEILKGEKEMTSENLKFWNYIKFTPTKWNEREYGDEGGGFWVVAKYKNFVLYYNDIEDGFNISEFEKDGEIKEYGAEQDELQYALIKFRKLIEFKS